MSVKRDLPELLRDDWFTRLVGFSEGSADEVRQNLRLAGETISSRVNGKKVQCGRLEVVSLADLQLRVFTLGPIKCGVLRLSEVVADVQQLHTDESNAGSLFQVASQFNLLEMVSPTVTPDEGVGIYEQDKTQGPACAIACGAGTIYRNYFVEVKGQRGQSANCQIDCLEDFGRTLGNTHGQLWEMQNGYALPSQQGLSEIDQLLSGMQKGGLDLLRSQLKIGLQWNSQVTLNNCEHVVTQAYCSALPVAYSNLPSRLWERFARLVLEAAYEATLLAGALNAAKTGNNTVYLTLLGGGAFGNDEQWITDAIERACELYRSFDLDVKIVSYGSSRASVRELVARLLS